MLRSLIATTFTGLAHNRLHAIVTLAGLALALAAALVIAIFVRQQYAYESFIPGSERIFRLSGTIEQPGQAVRVSPRSPATLARAVAARAPGIEGAARLMQDFPILRASGSSRQIREQRFAWVDSNFFKVLPLPAASGDPATALARPGAVVLTRSAARRYFGTEDMLGKSIDVALSPAQGRPGASPPKGPRQVQRLEVTAVIEDLPAETHLTTEVFAAGTTAGSALAVTDANPSPMISGTIFTYLRAAPGATAAQLQPALNDVVAPFQAVAAASGTKVELTAVPLPDIQFGPPADAPGAKPTISRGTIGTIAAIGALIVLMAATSYIALTTARAASRAPEVAVRKALGASRGQLVAHFLGESLIHVLLALVVAIVLVELTLPLVNLTMGTELSFNLLREPVFLLQLLAFLLFMTLLAGLAPAIVLSSANPATAMNGGRSGTGRSALLRQLTVAGQFGLMIALTVVALTMQRQTEFALERSLAADKAPTLMLEADCATGIGDLLREAPSVGSATCGSRGAFNLGQQGAATVIDGRGRRFTPGLVEVDSAFFSAMGIEILAGRALDAGDASARGIVINQTAARHFGFASPQAAVGQTLGFSLEVGPTPRTDPVRIVGVAADRPESVLVPANALLYQSWIRGPGLVAIEAPGYRFAPVHREIEAIWRKVGEEGPPNFTLLSQLERDRYRTLIVLGRVASACAVLALIIAGMGLFALSSFIVHQRRREIGIRKALGYNAADIARLLLWQFARPLLLAGLLALPLGHLAASRWLEGYAAKAEIAPVFLTGMLAAAMVFAMSIIASHVYSIARISPAVALRE